METRLNLNFVHVFPRHIFKSVTCRTFSEIKFSWVVSLSMYIIFWFCCKPRITCYYVTPSFFQSLPISYHPMRIRQDSNLCQGYMLYAGTANCTYYFYKDSSKIQLCNALFFALLAFRGHYFFLVLDRKSVV